MTPLSNRPGIKKLMKYYRKRRKCQYQAISFSPNVSYLIRDNSHHESKINPLHHGYSSTHQQQTAFENIVGKEEIAHKEQIAHKVQIAHNEHFLSFPQRFLLNQIIVPYYFVHIFDIFLTSYFYFQLNWKSPKLA